VLNTMISDVMQNQERRPVSIEYGVRRERYDQIRRLNPSSLSAGLMSRGEVDVLAIRDAFEGADQDRSRASQDGLDRGTLAHLLLLQPELVRDRVAIWNGSQRRGAEWDGFEDENAGKLIVRKADFDQVKLATSRLLDVPKIRKLFAGVHTEVALFGEEGEGIGTVYTKGLVDAVRGADDDGFHAILDLKTTDAGIDAQSVRYTTRRFHYREKLALYHRWYCRAAKADPELVRVFLVFVRLTNPLAVRVARVTTGALEWGSRRMLTAINDVRNAIQTEHWPVFVADDAADVDSWEIDEEEEIDYDE
jgi:hypothetical protein